MPPPIKTPVVSVGPGSSPPAHTDPLWPRRLHPSCSSLTKEVYHLHLPSKASQS
ncbi:hypothetical protein EYF80_067364 [Liparis tanakae]|uniref:Uncharacterized protein n=1 Tax=Liparis tanakae TaxID=230148 RepID=A0A4Z2E2B8_9TELE|nr:hypothetical protein EYF80_067364 [Liparis tanakae]